MRKNKLTTAVLAGITGVAGIASISNAVNLNPDGLGQVLIYPYYTVNNGLSTLLSVVNTTDQVKAVKVRFMEGENSREVLDFNLYMSPFDVWTGAIVDFTGTGFGGTIPSGDPSAAFVTFDRSCLAPDIRGNITLGEFRPFQFVGAFDDGGTQTSHRMREGHFEMIEMGNVDSTDPKGASAIHVNGEPSCAAIIGAWVSGGIWNIDASDAMLDPTGGLFGSASVVDVANGTDVAYNADAHNGFSSSILHTNPGSLFPSLNNSSTDSIVFYQGAVVNSSWPTGAEAFSASYMHNQVFNEFVLDNGISAKTEWVVTFPTKRFYVNTVPAIEPFTVPFDGTACEEYGANLWDREERTPGPGGIPISPVSPGPGNPILCYETNVVEFYNGNNPFGVDASNVFGSVNRATVSTDNFDEGWFAINFTQSTTAANAGTQEYVGLPVTGFAVQTFANADAQPGLLAQYAGLFRHKYTRLINSVVAN